MRRYPSLVTGSLLWLSTLSGLSVSQSTWTLDPQKHLAQMANHMTAVVGSTIYTIGGTAYYWTPKSTPGSVVSANNNSVYILKTSNSYLRAIDLSKPVDFEAQFSDTAEVISELPFEIPHVKRGAAWADQNTIYYWGGELEVEPVYMDGAFQNRTREWPDPMKYYTYDLSQPRGSGTWKTVSISVNGGSDKLTTSRSYGEYAYSAEARKAFYLGGVMSRQMLENRDGSNATRAGSKLFSVSSMTVYDAAANLWKNDTTTPAGLNELRDGAMVKLRVYIYICRFTRGRKGVVNKSISLAQVNFDAVYVYDIAAGFWYRQATTSKTNIYPEIRWGGFCVGAAAAPDKTSFTIYVYGGFKGGGHIKGTWALTMPYFQWFPVDSSGEPELGRSSTTCQTIGGQLAMVRGRAEQIGRGDTNGGTYFYDMTNLTWSLKYQPSDYRVPKIIYDVIGGNGEGSATITGPADDKNFAGGLGTLFAAAAANTTGSPSPSTGPGGGGGGGGESSTPTGAIAGGVVGGVAGLAAIGTGVWMLLRRRRLRSADMAMEGGAMVGAQENSLMGMHKHPLEPDYEGGSPRRYEMDSVPIARPVHELDSTGAQGGTNK
ncbi:hypothetical protein C7212DRAFT_361856 [Tuber magnatum]|uniref:Kelch repeat protein n=1 Tax=Tuber magnatum TaxID=42249 RepID=A0A317SXF8_9PEZI|nr:hypothetical protein C7212DRAFT_361856 [Tuber magnatum]